MYPKFFTPALYQVSAVQSGESKNSFVEIKNEIVFKKKNVQMYHFIECYKIECCRTKVEQS